MRTPTIFRKLRGQSGFSLLEVLSSVTIFGVVAMGAAAGTMSTIRGNTVSRMNLTASQLIYDQVEKFRALDPTDGPAEFAQGTHADANNPIDANGDSGGKFNRSWQVTRNSPSFGLAEITVTVSWTDTRERSIAAATYVCLQENCS
jgi:prepilin-type N-terminal cleavage/methylation domain-containing protein